MESGAVYGYRKIHAVLRDLGKEIGKHQVDRLMGTAGLRAEVAYGKRRSFNGGKPAVVTENLLDRQFNPGQSNRAWGTDITMIRRSGGWRYLTVVLDLFSRQVVG